MLNVRNLLKVKGQAVDREGTGAPQTGCSATAHVVELGHEALSNRFRNGLIVYLVLS